MDRAPAVWHLQAAMAAESRRIEAGAKVTVKDFPGADELLQCALPILVRTSPNAEYGLEADVGIAGTCMALRVGNRVVFATAKHVVGEVVPGAEFYIPLKFDGGYEGCRVAHVVMPKSTHEEFDDVCDLAILLPDGAPAFAAGHSAPIDLTRIANMGVVKKGALFAVAGYPARHPTGNAVNRQERRIDFGKFLAIAKYEKAWDKGDCHTLQVAAQNVGGTAGMSGSPVLRLVRRADGSWDQALAGIALRGNERLLHFADARFLAEFLGRESGKWP